ncbi:unnamed protein product [Arctogadus glacialis]
MTSGASPVGLVLAAVVFLSYAVAIAFEGAEEREETGDRTQARRSETAAGPKQPGAHGALWAGGAGAPSGGQWGWLPAGFMTRPEVQLQRLPFRPSDPRLSGPRAPGARLQETETGPLCHRGPV